MIFTAFAKKTEYSNTFNLNLISFLIWQEHVFTTKRFGSGDCTAFMLAPGNTRPKMKLNANFHRPSLQMFCSKFMQEQLHSIGCMSERFKFFG
jgi:hypothetical protein